MGIMNTKTCAHCNQEKPVSEFYKVARSWSSWCKSCHREWSKSQAKQGYFVKLRDQKRGQGAKRVPLTPVIRLARILWRGAYKRAKTKHEEFHLSVECVEQKLSDFCEQQYYVLEPEHPFRPSLDRINPRRPYADDNVQIVWWIENCAKNGFSEEQLIEFCRRKLGLPPVQE